MFDTKEWLEDIEAYTHTQYGSDDFIHGNYVEWDAFRKEQEENLLSAAGIELPWGKLLPIKQYFKLLTDLSDFGVKIIDDLNENLDLEVKFIERNSELGDILVSECLDLYGVPSGTRYEFDYDLPIELTYFGSMLLNTENEFVEYKNHPIEFHSFNSKVKSIFDKIECTTDELTKKSLLLAAFSITESMFKSLIVNKIPQENNISNFSKKILEEEIDKKLRGNSEIKNKLFKELYGKPAPQQNWINLRNSLAHDIESSSISNEQIEYFNYRTKQDEQYLLSNLKQDLTNFYDELKSMLD